MVRKDSGAYSRVKRHIDNLKKSGGKRSTVALQPETVAALAQLRESDYGMDDTQVINRAIREAASRQGKNDK